MSGADGILDAYARGHHALLVTGRSLYDFDVDPADGKLRPVLEIVRRQLFRDFAVHLVEPRPILNHRNDACTVERRALCRWPL